MKKYNLRREYIFFNLTTIIYSAQKYIQTKIKIKQKNHERFWFTFSPLQINKMLRTLPCDQVIDLNL